MTGVPFSEHAEPQFSVELKQQIDSFISRHGSDVFRDKSTDSSSLGQTLGSAAEIALHLSSAKPPPGKPGAVNKRGSTIVSPGCCSTSTHAVFQNIECFQSDNRQVLGRSGPK